MAYTCNVKGLEELEKLGRNECTLHRWRRSPDKSQISGKKIVGIITGNWEKRK